MRLLLSCLLVLAVHPAGAQDGAADFAPERLTAFYRELETILSETDTPGLGAVLATRDRVVWAGGLGVEGKVSNRPVTEGTVFRIGSISKCFVALAAMMLVEEGKLDLRAPLRELAPEIEFENRWAESDPVRMVHLMEHTTGWDDLALREYVHSVYPPLSLRAGLAFDPRSRTCRWPPGRSMSYCNSGPAVAAYVIQQIAQQDFEAFVQERIFDPLDMTAASFRGDGTLGLRLATGYDRGKPVDYWNILLRPAGAINATPRGMANYLRFFMNEGELEGLRLVKPESIDRMKEARTPRAVRAGVEQWYGLHLARYAEKGQVWYGHTGGMPGYLADLAWCPALEVGYVIMVNSSTGGGFGRIREAFQKFLTEGREPAERPVVPELEPGALASLEGFYLPSTPRAERTRFMAPFAGVVQVSAEDDGLVLRSLPQNRDKLVPVEARLFRRPDSPLASAVFYDGDSEGEASFATGAEYRLVSPVFIWTHWVLGGVAFVLMATTLLFALIWLPRLLFGRKLAREPFLSVRVLPFLATLFFAGAVASAATGLPDPINRFGEPTVWSIGFMVATILFALAAMGGLCVSFSAKRSGINKVVRWHALLVSMSQMVVALYLAYWGLIGFQSWI